MIQKVIVNKELADRVERELYSHIVPWTFFKDTTDFYVRALAHQQEMIDKHSATYGPVVDTQRFTYMVYQLGFGKPVFYDTIKTNPQSFHRKNFKNLSSLIDLFENRVKPSTHVVERIMVNMQTMRPQWSLNNIHPDLKTPGGITVLYYVNDSDGDTYFFDEDKCIQRVAPIKGTAVVYPANTFHAGSTPVTTNTRTVINMVFIPKQDTNWGQYD